jgi:hypothetical protein
MMQINGPGQEAKNVKTQVITNVMTRAVATTFAAPLVASTISRLLVDLNQVQPVFRGHCLGGSGMIMSKK